MTEQLVRFGEIKERYFPARWEMYLYLIGIFFVFYQALTMIGARAGAVTIAAGAGGLIAFCMAFFGGMRLCLPLYFATFFGVAIVIPGFPISLNRGFAAIFFLAFIFDVVRWRPGVSWNVPLVAFLLLNVSVLATTAVRMDPRSDFPIFLIFYLVMFFGVVFYFWREQWLRGFAAAAVIVSIPTIILPGFIELVIGRNITTTGLAQLRYGRVDGFAKNAIIYGYTATWIMPFLLFWMLESKRLWVRAAIVALTLMTLLACFGTQNRQTPVIILVLMAVFLLSIRHRHKVPMIAASIAGVVLLAPYATLKLWERVSTVTVLMKDISLMFRHDKLLIASRMWPDYFWFGIGYEQFRYRWWEYRPYGELLLVHTAKVDQWIDSGYLQVLTEFGAVGFLLFTVVILGAYRLLWRAARVARGFEETWYANMVAANLALLTHFVFSNIMADQFLTPQATLMLGIVFATVTMIDRKEREVAATRSVPATP